MLFGYLLNVIFKYYLNQWRLANPNINRVILAHSSTHTYIHITHIMISCGRYRNPQHFILYKEFYVKVSETKKTIYKKNKQLFLLVGLLKRLQSRSSINTQALLIKTSNLQNVSVEARWLDTVNLKSKNTII